MLSSFPKGEGVTIVERKQASASASYFPPYIQSLSRLPYVEIQISLQIIIVPIPLFAAPRPLPGRGGKGGKAYIYTVVVSKFNLLLDMALPA